MNILLIGATSEAARSVKAAAAALPDVNLIGTTSRNADIEGVHKTIRNISLTEKPKEIIAAIRKELPGKVDWLIYTPAFGPVGYPVAETTDKDMEAALDFSVYPLIEMMKEFRPEHTIAFSSFYWLPHITVAYGGLGAAKMILEKLALEIPEQLSIIRSGLFNSNSLRGICLLIYRQLRATSHEYLQFLNRQYKESGLRFPEFFLLYAHDQEKKMFEKKFDEAHRPTESRDLTACIEAILNGEREAIHNVIGSWRWKEKSMPQTSGEWDITRAFAGKKIPELLEKLPAPVR